MRNFGALAVIAAMGFGAQPASAQTAPGAAQEWLQCRNQDNAIDQEKAINACTRILTRAGLPRDEQVEALLMRAWALYLSDDHDSALPDLDRALPLAGKPGDRARILGLRGTIRVQRKRTEQGLADLDAALAASPDYTWALIQRARVKEGQGKMREALADYDRTNQLDPRNPDARNGACWLRAAELNAELSKALVDCDVAVRLVPGEKAFLDSRGMVALRLGQWKAAYEEYDAAVRIDPQYASALFGRGLAASRMRRGDGGAADVAKAIQIEPGIASDYARRGLRVGQTP